MNYEKPELLDLSTNIVLGNGLECSTGSVAGTDQCAYCSSVGGDAHGYCIAGGLAHGETGCAAYCSSSGSTANFGACGAGDIASAACNSSGGNAPGGCSAGVVPH
jgi:hypothetical protein